MNLTIRKKVREILFINMRGLGKNPFEDSQIMIQEGTVVGVYFLEETLKRTFIEKIKGKLAVVDGVSEKEYQVEYKNLDFIPEERINSSLSCQEYVYMYCMIRRGFNNMLEEKFEQILRQLNLGFLKEQKVGELGEGFQVIVRCIAAYLVGIQLLVFQNEIRFREAAEKEIFRTFLEYFKRDNGIGLLVSTRKEQLEELADVIYEIV